MAWHDIVTCTSRPAPAGKLCDDLAAAWHRLPLLQAPFDAPSELGRVDLTSARLVT